MIKNNVDKTEHYKNQRVTDWKETLVKLAFAHFWKCLLLVIIVLVGLIVAVRTSIKYIEKSDALSELVEIKDNLLNKFMRKDEKDEAINQLLLQKQNPIKFEKQEAK